jgi:hypothetical protein
VLRSPPVDDVRAHIVVVVMSLGSLRRISMTGSILGRSVRSRRILRSILRSRSIVRSGSRRRCEAALGGVGADAVMGGVRGGEGGDLAAFRDGLPTHRAQLQL